MSPTRRIALIAGIFFALTFVHALILPFYDDVLNDKEFILGSGNINSVRFGAIAEIITIVSNVATGVVLYQVLRREQRAMALGYVGVRIFESTIIAVGTVCLLGILTLREDFGGSSDPGNLTDIAAALVAVRDWTFMFGPGLCSGFGNGLLLGLLMFRSRLVPRPMALIGVIGGPLSLVGCMFVLFGQWDQDAPPQFLLTLAEIAWELSLTVYLIAKGFNATPLTAEMDRELAAA